MKKRHNHPRKARTRKPDLGPSIYKLDPTTNLWKGEDGLNYRLDTHGTTPPHLDLRKEA